MGIRLFLALLFLLGYGFAEAQDQQVPERRSIIKFNTFAAIDQFNFPTIQFSYERRVARKISWAAELGVQCYKNNLSPQTSSSDTSFTTPRGIKASVEGRYYFFEPASKKIFRLQLYVGINLFTQHNRSDVVVSYLKDSLTEARDCFWMKKSNPGAAVTSGMQLIGGRVVLEFYTAMGVKNRTVVNYNREYDTNKDELSVNRHGFGQERALFSDYNGPQFAFSGGFRIGIAF